MVGSTQQTGIRVVEGRGREQAQTSDDLFGLKKAGMHPTFDILLCSDPSLWSPELPLCFDHPPTRAAKPVGQSIIHRIDMVRISLAHQCEVMRNALKFAPFHFHRQRPLSEKHPYSFTCRRGAYQLSCNTSVYTSLSHVTMHAESAKMPSHLPGKLYACASHLLQGPSFIHLLEGWATSEGVSWGKPFTLAQRQEISVEIFVTGTDN